MSKSLNLRRSQAQENTAARKLGGKVNPGSGNGWARKNDVRTDTESIECKITERKSYSLKLAELRTAEFHAAVDNRDMRFLVTFIDSSGMKHSYIILPENDYLSMKEQLETI